MGTQTTMTVHCAKCNHQWEVPMPLPLPISYATALMRTACREGCPSCGAVGKSVMCGTKLTPEQFAAAQARA